MKNILKAKDFDFEYTGSNYSEEDVVELGFIQLTGKELLSRMSNKTVYGDYPMGYTFVAHIYENGKTEGINNVGSHDFGHWVIDMEKHTLSIRWNNGWLDTITRAYKVNGNIEFYDVETGNWRTTFKEFTNLDGK